MARSLRALGGGFSLGFRQVAGRLTLLLALVLPLLAGGCAQVGLVPAESTDPTVMPGRTITVQPGDQLYLIARHHNVQSRDIITLNHLKPPYRLEIGQTLHLPGARLYTVRAGDSLSGIAQRYHYDTAQLARINQIAGPSYIIRVGQQLTLPTESAEAPPPAPEHKPEANPVHGIATGPIQTVPLAPPPPAAPTPLAPAPAKVAGPAPAKLAGPAPAKVAAPAPARVSAPPKASREAAQALAMIPTARKPDAPATVKPAAPEATPVSAMVVEVPAPPAGGTKFLWPVKGSVISEYGGKPDGTQNDGVNIAAALGTPVIAADNGVVAYVGNELRSYGNLLLIRHASGLVTAYAHLDTTLVQRGAKVRRGQKIATVGASGKVSAPQVHFEVRRGSQAVDPGDYLENRT